MTPPSLPDARSARFLKTGIGIALLAALLAVVAATVLRTDRIREVERTAPADSTSFAAVFDPRLVALGSAGYRQFLSAIAWVECIELYAGEVLDGRDSRERMGWTDLVFALDTNWAYPYEFAGLTYWTEKSRDRSFALRALGQGIRQFPEQWNLRVYWAMLAREQGLAPDSLAEVLLPISQGAMSSPPYARTLAFTLLTKEGEGTKAMDLLAQTYAQARDPLLRAQFQAKIGDLLHRGGVRLGPDSATFVRAAGSLLGSGDPQQERLARDLLVALSDTTRRARALPQARSLAAQYREYSTDQR